MTLCSVVIPWHRGIADLRRAVDSVLAQSHTRFEIIAVANGVSDADFAEAAALSSDPRYRAVRLEKADVSPARNHGAALASGELIFFLDADDRFHPGKLARFVELARAAPFDVAFSRGLRRRPGGVSWPWPVGHWDGRTPVAEFFFCEGGTISTSALVIAQRSREPLRFREPSRPYEDPELVIRAEHLGLRVVMLPEPLYDYFDERIDNRLSSKDNWADRLVWIDEMPDNVSDKARAAFRVRCVAQHLFPAKTLMCAGFFWDAFLKRAVPMRDLALFVIRGLIPRRLRHALVNRYFTSRAAHEARTPQAAGDVSQAVSLRGKP
jgi:glycosyltransferase involved in cell wall biosynthesis